MSSSGRVPSARTPLHPPLALLHAAMLLSGFGTVFLGPALPALAASAHASDSGSGLFFSAQFAGAFVGGVTTSSRLYFCLVRGLAAAASGFLLLALATDLHAGLAWYAAALVLVGFGVGQMLTSVNLLAAQRAEEERTVALSLINFTWSLGAVTSPFLLGSALTSASLTTVIPCISIPFAAVLAVAVWIGRGRIRLPMLPRQSADNGLPRSAFVAFAAMLLIYGGVETCLSGWITTFGTRYGNATLRVSSLGVTAMWIGITAGRALAPLLLRVVRERLLLMISLGTATAIVAILSRASGAASITVLAACLGLSLAPWFPLVLSSMLNRGASPHETGFILAVSGIGAAILPFLLGMVSRSTGSLRTALAVPLAGLVALLLLALGTRSSNALKSV